MPTQKVMMIMILFLLIVSCAVPLRNNVVTIGIVISPDEYGINVLKGAQLAVKEADLHNVRFMVEKSVCDAKKADSIAEKLFILHKVQVVIEGVCPEVAMALMPLAADHTVVMLSAVSSTSSLSSPWVFRTIPNDDSEAAFAADLFSQKQITTAAILSQNEGEADTTQNIFEKEFSGQGGQVVAKESFEKNSSRFEQQLEMIADSPATAVYVITDSPKAARLFLQQRQQRAISIPIYGSKWFKTNEILTLGEAAQGLIVISPRLGNIGFITKYTEEYGTEPGLFAAQGYDAYKALALTIQQGARTSKEIREALLNVEFQGASGQVNFDENRNVAGSFEVYVVNEGVFEPQ